MELLASFGPYRVSEIERLELDPTVDLEDVFLVPFPNYAVSQRVYFSSDFAAFLNEGMGKTCTSRFNLNFATRPKPPPAPRGPY